MMKMNYFVWIVCLLLASCNGDDSSLQNQSPSQPQAMAVEVFTVQAVNVPNIIELPGRVESVRQAEVRARVNGIVQKRHYEEGTDVKEGQVLFSIDPRELRANLAQVKASLQRAEATAANARALVERYRPLVAEQAISRQEYDSAIAASQEADANIAQIEAQSD